ncbi:MAG: WYL domain-containing protein [Ornithinimicrobium sp.]
MGTTERVLALLSLLQAAPVHTGADLARRLGVTQRCVRRDVGRLREMGYAVLSSRGAGGGYRLAGGKVLPPLLLTDEEAIAVAVSLRWAAGGSVAGASEAALATAAKLDAVTPPRLRSEIRAILDVTQTLMAQDSQVDGETLLALARACRDTVRTTISYAARDGSVSERTVEPYRLVATGRWWYVMAWDRTREDWRTFGLDRIRRVTNSTLTFTVRDHPEPAAYVQAFLTSSPYRHQAVVRMAASADAVAARVRPRAVTVTPETSGTCLVSTGADDLEHLALHLASMGIDFEVIEPLALGEALTRLSERLAASALPLAKDKAGPRPAIAQSPVV